jgi:hypothetical protein
VNAFVSAMAEEMASARAELRAAQSREDETAAAEAAARLADLSEILARAQEGLRRPTA